MFRTKPPVDLETTGTALSHARGPILLHVNLADGTQRPVFLSNLTTHVAHGVLTATGTVNIPGEGRDTFTAVVQAEHTSDTSVAVMLDLGSFRREPVCLVSDVSHLLDNDAGAGRAANCVSSLLTQPSRAPAPSRTPCRSPDPMRDPGSRVCSGSSGVAAA